MLNLVYFTALTNQFKMIGRYNSTNAFVETNNLQDKANLLWGEGWEACDDVHQIEELLSSIHPNQYLVSFLENVKEDDILVTESNGSDMNNFERQIHNIILIHVARTWERIRVKQPYEEMPLDNIASTEAIEEIAYDIFQKDLIQDFIREKDGSIWDRYGDGCSDTYIERIAASIIEDRYLDIKNKHKFIPSGHDDKVFKLFCNIASEFNASDLLHEIITRYCDDQDLGEITEHLQDVISNTIKTHENE